MQQEFFSYLLWFRLDDGFCISRPREFTLQRKYFRVLAGCQDRYYTGFEILKLKMGIWSAFRKLIYHAGANLSKDFNYSCLFTSEELTQPQGHPTSRFTRKRVINSQERLTCGKGLAICEYQNSEPIQSFQSNTPLADLLGIQIVSEAKPKL